MEMSSTASIRKTRPRKEYQLQDLQEIVPPAMLSAPRLDWSRLDRRHLNYLIRTVYGDEAMWFEHLVFSAAILATYIGLEPHTVQLHLHYLHGRWRILFPAYGLRVFAEWNPEEHLPRYLVAPIFTDTLNTRQNFLRTSTISADYSQAYLKALPQAERECYQSWALPPFPWRQARKLSRRPEIVEIQKQQRKRESDAITPHLPQIRGEAHLRWNELRRLRSKFEEALTLVQSGQKTVPLAFSYEEPRYGQRFHFIVWDRPRFVLAHEQSYGLRARRRAQKQAKEQVSEPDSYFLEFVRAESLHPTEEQTSSDGPLWFGDLLRYGLLRDNPFRGKEEELKRQRTYLESWGYLSEDEEMARAPFRTCVSGLLTSPRAQALFLAEAHRLTQKVVFQVEPLYAAATFGLTSLDLLTSTGMRINELFPRDAQRDETLELSSVVRDSIPFQRRRRRKNREQRGVKMSAF